MVGFRVMERPIPLLMCEALDEACAAARLARELAPRLCVRSSAETPETPGCVEYHSLYPTLRLLSLAASPDRHADFFGAVFDSLAKSGATHRVLITGTADSGILEYLLLAWHRANAAYPSIKALDLCETPLRLCKAYGQRLGVPVDIRAGNVLSSGFPEPFDLICAHSFIVKFDDEARPLLFAKWAELLKPGGCVVSTVRIDPDRGVRTIAHTTDQADAFESRVLAAAADWLEALGTDVATLKHELACHAKAVISVPVATPEQLEQELEVAGFAIERLDVVDRGRAAASSGGAGGERRATYADFVARRI
jgi:SAM-dependent methyltransferase